MAEAFVGTWQMGPPFPPSFAEFFKGVGKSDVLDVFMADCTLELSLEGGNRLINKTTIQGKPPGEFHQVTVIGGKTEDVFPGLGVVEVECNMEGGKLVSKGTHNGQPLIKELYIEGGKLMHVAKFGNITCIMLFSKI